MREILGHRCSKSLLAQSLDSQCYVRNPGFESYIKNGLPFNAHPEFRQADLDARQLLY